VTFDVPADAYARFMGRFSEPLGVVFADFADIAPGQSVLDVGSGPGALTTELVRRFGATSVAAIDPSPPFVASLQARLPEVDVRAGAAEHLPYDDNTFDAALAQLVVHFMSDPVAGLREMGRVTRPGGVVAACVWDHDGGDTPLSLCWTVARELDPAAVDESGLAGARQGHLEQLCAEAGLSDVEATKLHVDVEFASFDEWWEPYTFGIGPLGAYIGGLDAQGRTALRAACAERLPAAPFTVRASAWATRARA
jgi:ubiquinone/menaquinone biosynthesis C-methylase UbiE